MHNTIDLFSEYCMPRQVSTGIALAATALEVAGLSACQSADPGDVFACDDTRQGGVACVEAADGSTWEVADVVVATDFETGRSGVVLVTSLLCPHVSDSEPRYVEVDLCAAVDVFGGRLVAEEFIGYESVKRGLSSGLSFYQRDDGSVAVDRSRGGIQYECSHVNEPWEGPVPVGEVSELSGGTFTITKSNTRRAIVELDFPIARARLTARYCDEEAK